jgi:hypothetical protein
MHRFLSLIIEFYWPAVRAQRMGEVFAGMPAEAIACPDPCEWLTSRQRGAPRRADGADAMLHRLVGTPQRIAARG